jgi:Skp family chaperone for outer membrane proteins
VKKTIALLTGLSAVCGFVAWAGWAAAQPPGTRPPVQQASATAPAPTAAPGTRVAVVNINTVLKNYQKAQALNNAIKQDVQTYATQMNQKRDEINRLQADLTKPTTTPAQKDQWEKQIVNLQRALQDLDNEARKVISKKQGDIAVNIFHEIEDVIKAVATTNNFDLVLSYPDATTNDELYSQDNVVRKLASQAAIPIFYKPHIDITSAVVQTLNARHPVQQAGAAATPAPPATPR